LAQNAAAVDSTSTPSISAVAPVQKDNNGMTGGAKAGLAIGIILALGIIAGLVFFFLRLKRKSKDQETQADDDAEKNGFRGPQTLVRTRSSIRKSRFSAPRLMSLRPISQLFPAGEKQEGDEHAQAAHVAPIQHTLIGHQTSSDPFGDHAAAKASNASVPTLSAVDVPKPLSIKAIGRDRNGSVADSFMSGSTALGSQTAASEGPNNVHRVHIDFIPSMDDELELRAGALVRMLHEYDDGWVSWT